MPDVKQLKYPPKLDQFVLDIEFLLISVIQGVALAALAQSSIEPITQLNFQFWPYIISGFLIILIFWSQAIVHALSFIDWPFNLSHSFLYFLVSFVEVLVFSQITNPLGWFGFVGVFFIVATILYLFDLQLIKQHWQRLGNSASGKTLYAHLINGQIMELTFFLPIGFAFNALAFLLIYRLPELFIQDRFHVYVAILQVLFGLGFMLNSIKSFKTRSKLIVAHRTLESI